MANIFNDFLILNFNNPKIYRYVAKIGSGINCPFNLVGI